MNIRNLCLFSPGLKVLMLSALVSFPLPSLALTGPSYSIPDADMIFLGDRTGSLTCNYFYLSGDYAYCPAGTVLSGTATLSYIPGSDGGASTYIYSGPVNMWKADESDKTAWAKLTERGYCVSGDKVSFTNGQFSASVGDGTTAVLHATSFSATIQGTDVTFPSEGSSEVTSTGFWEQYNSADNDNTYSYFVSYGMCNYWITDSMGNSNFSGAVFNLDSGYLVNTGVQRSEVINYINRKVEAYESRYYSEYLADDSSDDSSSDDSDSSDDTSSGDSGTTEGDSGDSGTTGGDSGDSGTTGGDSGDSGTTEGDSGDSGTTDGDSGDSGTTGGNSGTTDEDSGSSGGSTSGGSSSGGSSGGGSSGGGSSGGSSSGGSSGDSGTTEGDSGTIGGDSGTTGGDSGDSGSVLPPDDSGGDDSGGSAVVTPDDPVTDPPDSSEGSSGSEGSSSSGGSSSGDSSDSGSSGDSAGSGSSSGSGSASGSGSDSSTSGGSGDSDDDGDGILAWLKKIYNAVVAIPSSLLPSEGAFDSSLSSLESGLSSVDTQASEDIEKEYLGEDTDSDGFGDSKWNQYIPGYGMSYSEIFSGAPDYWFTLDIDSVINVNNGSSIPLQFTFTFYIPGIGDINLVIDTTTMSEAYDTYIRPVLEYAIYMMTFIRCFVIARRTIFLSEVVV